MHGIHKRFPGVHALDDVSFEVRAGEVHALMGQNGAGKSTLIKVLTGVHPRDGGSILFLGRPFRASSPADAQHQGISTIYQEVNLVPTLSVAENLSLGQAPRRWYGIDWRSVRRQARERLAEFDLRLDVDAALGSFPVAIQQMVCIARAVAAQARLLIMDEPTSSLDRRETDRLFEIIGRLKARGVGVVFVTHFLDQVYRVSDRITVLRNGRLAGSFEAAQLPRIELVAHMLGKPIEETTALDSRASTARGPQATSAVPSLLSARRLGRRGAVEPFSLELRAGEVLGLAGLLGSGRTETARLLFAADRGDTGELTVGGARVPGRHPREAIAVGLALCPEDRKADGIIPEMSVRENIALVVQRQLSRLGLVSRRRHAQIAEEYVRRLGIATPDLDRPVKTLSGGNQQKVILARWLASRPRVLILDEPTRGIDVGAKVEIERLTDRLAAEGLGVLFISSELDEVVRRSHRLIVLRDRRHIGTLAGDDLSEEAVMNLIAAPAGQGDLGSGGRP